VRLIFPEGTGNVFHEDFLEQIGIFSPVASMQPYEEIRFKDDFLKSDGEDDDETMEVSTYATGGSFSSGLVDASNGSAESVGGGSVEWEEWCVVVVVVATRVSVTKRPKSSSSSE
jgi:hypothetical protein